MYELFQGDIGSRRFVFVNINLALQIPILHYLILCSVDTQVHGLEYKSKYGLKLSWKK